MKMLKTIGSITYELLRIIRYAIVSSVYNVGVIVSMVCPYVMYVLGQYVALERGEIAFGAELFFPVVLGIISYYMKAIGNRAGKGASIPMPSKRFTEVDGDGEVTVEQARLTELILYTADLEDWFAKKGML